jgi:DNA-binding MarR family transcriptional regulator
MTLNGRCTRPRTYVRAQPTVHVAPCQNERVQEPLENLSENARRVHAYLAQDPNRTEKLEDIARSIRLTPGQTADALRELQAAERADETFGGWSVLT